MPSHPAVLTPPSRLPKVPFVTEAQLAHLLRTTPETLRAWRRRGEMPAVAAGPERDEFCRSLKVHGRWPVCYRISDVSAWLFGTGGPGGRPKELPASAFDHENDRTALLRRAAEGTPDPKEKKRLLKQLTGQAKFAARLGFESVTAYEAWIARGSPEDELPPECRHDLDAPLIDDESTERLQQRTDAAIAKMRGVSPKVVTAERKRAEPPPPVPTPRAVEPPHDPQKSRSLTQSVQPARPLHDDEKSTSSPASPWAVLDDDPLFDPFATGRTPRRQGSGYWGH